MAEEYKYYAFISYKREDEKQAKWLQNKLEHYKLPTVVRTENPSLPETIYPIFRDTTDLSGGFLAGAIEDALKSSKYLIVVCSPRAAQSQWVCKEVQYFIDSGREKYIIPFIIDGEPNSKNIAEECFPKNLRNLSGEKEILGINISEMGRDAAAIKVVARMFDLRFDTLWQRYERSKKIKRIQLYCLSLLVAIIGLVVGAIFIYQNGQISNKNVEIQNQNKLLEIKNDSLKIAFLNLAKAKEDIEQRNQALTKSRDSIVSINSKLNTANSEIILKNLSLRKINKTILAEMAVKNMLLNNNLLAKQNIANMCLDSDDEELLSVPKAEYVMRTSYWNSLKRGIEGDFTYDFEEDFEIINNSVNDSLVGLFLKNSNEIIAFNFNKREITKKFSLGNDFDVCSYNPITDVAVYTFDDSVLYVRNLRTGKDVTNPISAKQEEDIECCGVSENQQRIMYEIYNEKSGIGRYHILDLQENTIYDLIPSLVECFDFSKDGKQAIMDLMIDEDSTKFVLCDFELYTYAELPSLQKRWNPNTYNYRFIDNYEISFIDRNEMGKDCMYIYNTLFDSIMNVKIPLDEFKHKNWVAYSPKGSFFCSYKNKVLGVDRIYPFQKIPIIDQEFSIEIPNLKLINEFDIPCVFNTSENKLLYKSIASSGGYQLGILNLNIDKRRKDIVLRSGKRYLDYNYDYPEYHVELRDVMTDSIIGFPMILSGVPSYYSDKFDDDNRIIFPNDSSILICDFCQQSLERIPVNYRIREYDFDNRMLILTFIGSGFGFEVYDMNTYKLISRKDFEDTWIESPLIIKSQNKIAIKTRFGIMIYDDLTFNLINTIPYENGNVVSNIALSSNQKLLAYGDESFKLYIWDIEKNKLVKKFMIPLASNDIILKKISFSPDDNYICLSSYNKSYIYNIDTEELVLEIPDYCFFCTETNKICVGGDYLYDFPTMEELREYYKTWE